MKIGVFDHLSSHLGGGQLVVARVAAVLSKQYSVELVHSGTGYTLAQLEAVFGLDLSRTKERIIRDSLRSFAVPGGQSMSWYLRAGLQWDRALTAPYDLFVYSGHGVPPVSYAGTALAYCHFPREARPSIEVELTAGWHRRHRVDRAIRLAVYQRLWRYRMRGYRAVLANSRFTASWVERLWARDAEVVYPPVSIDDVRREKRNLIVAIGRFDGRDRKNLAVQLQAFPEFLARVREKWSLCMIGFCRDSSEDVAHVENLRQLAAGLPVTFVVNAERSVVRNWIAEAKLFWHTRGLASTGEGIAPEYMEHFGIATVEAMMAGCVPIVPACGGQPEIVDHEVNGFLCPDVDALVRHSARLANDERLRQQMSSKAEERSMAFDPAVFDGHVGRRVQESLRWIETPPRSV